MLNIAVVGSGPAGMYLVEALTKASAGAVQVDVIDRLPTPYGLIRSGVAPDHATVRAVTQRFELAFDKPGVRLVGAVEVGRDVRLSELRQLYDVVVLANGCQVDKRLGIPGEQLPGVWGSACFSGWYNAHPDHIGLDIADLPETVVVIGNGNVAIDAARLMTKTEQALAATDMAPQAVALLGRSQVRKVVLAGRRGPADARFSVKELEELGEVANVSLVMPEGMTWPSDAEIDAMPPAQGAMLQALRGYAAQPTVGRPRDIELQFLARPVEILGADRVEGVRFERMALAADGVRGTGVCFDVACGAVITCIGYQARPFEAVPMDAQRGGFQNDEGCIEPGLYCTGWARRGPSGTIATNRVDANQVAQRLLREQQPRGTAGPAGLDRLLQQRDVCLASVSHWRAIDQAERARAEGAAPRRKFQTLAEMRAVCKGLAA